MQVDAVGADAQPGRTAIVIFGAYVAPDGTPSPTLSGRVAAALRCGASLPRPLYVPTGAARGGGSVEAAVIAGLLRDAGVPGEDILIEATAGNTLRSALACAAVLRGHGGPVLAASSAWHLPRCLMLLRLAGCPAAPCAATDRDGRAWWRLREIVARVVDPVLLGLIRVAGTRGKAPVPELSRHPPSPRHGAGR